MAKKNKKNQNEEAKAAQQEAVQEQENLNTEKQAQENTVEEDPMARIAKLEEELEQEKKKYAYKLAEFENFRKRTLNEKAELIKNGAESAMRDLLPVIDDVERALDAINKGGDLESIKEGVGLIYNKFIKYLEGLVAKYPIISIEDPIDENNWDDWKTITAELGKKVQHRDYAHRTHNEADDDKYNIPRFISI